MEIALPAAFITTLGEFRIEQARTILGHLISAKASSGFASQYLKQVDAWEEEFELLSDLALKLTRREPSSCNWAILLEYPIPRRNKFPDTIVLAAELIFIIEFKFGAASFDPAGKWQVEDYALDLRDFHRESQGKSIIPILVATAAAVSGPRTFPDGDKWPVACVARDDLANFIEQAFHFAHKPNAAPLVADIWNDSAYRPSLNIIDAANELFTGHSVREISHAYADNLSITTDALVDIVLNTRDKGGWTICFVTGVPGAGKTLTGLNLVHNPILHAQEKHPAVFLSGNGPLVKIIRHALVRNAAWSRGRGKKEAFREVGASVQNVHSFLEEYMGKNASDSPHENVVVFDEAQRAWDAHQVKKKRGYDKSEPSLMLEIMERQPDWCVVVALVGGGQEIHTGEAGLAEWGRALSGSPKKWNVFVSPEVLEGGASLAGHRLFNGDAPPNCVVSALPSLHLNVSVRSFRAQTLTQWVEYLLKGNAQAARCSSLDRLRNQSRAVSSSRVAKPTFDDCRVSSCGAARKARPL